MSYRGNGNYAQNSIFGIKLNNIAFFAVLAVVLYGFVKILKLPLDAAKGITDLFGENDHEKAVNEQNVKTAEKTLAQTGKYGSPSGAETAKAEQLFKLLDGYFNQNKVAELFGTISGKYEMNRITSAFGIRYIIHGGIPFLRTPIRGDLPTHLGVYDIDLSKVHKRKDGSSFTIKMMLDHIGR